MTKPTKRPHHPGQRELFRVTPSGRVKTRTVYEPSDELRTRHADMLDRLRSYNIAMPRATGGIRGKSVADNVGPHRHHDHFYMIDIADAYESVDIDELTRVAHDALYRLHTPRDEIADVVDFIETDAQIEGVPGLPMGYPASPYLFNLYCKPMDEILSAGLNIREIFVGHAFSYTRWLDDLTFSSAEPFTKRSRDWLREHVEATPGFFIAHHKSRLHSLEEGPVTITGLSIYPDRRIQPTPHLIDAITKSFARIAEILSSGVALTPEELGELNGYNSVLHIGGDPLRSGSSVLVHLSRVHQRLSARAAELADTI